MRKLLVPFLAVAALTVGCSGGDDDPTLDASDDDTSSTSSTLAPGATVTTAPATADPTATTAATLPPGLTTDTTPIDPATVETLPLPDDPPPPADPGFPPPELGTYSFQTQGTSSLPGQNIDGPTTTTVTSLGPNEVRHATDRPQQILDLQYRPDGVYVRQLIAGVAGQTLTFQSPDGVLFVPIPQAPGASWQWQLTDTTGGITAAWTGTTRPAETITAAGAPVEASVIAADVVLTGTYAGFPVNGTMRLTLWIDPARRLPVQVHQVTTVTSPFAVNAESTSTLTGFTPA